MAIVTRFGKPDLFITMTSNPKWREISENLLPGQTAQDAPDLIARVFRMKHKALLADIKEHWILGKTTAWVSVTEFQKRGLPHAHMLFTMATEDKPNTVDLGKYNNFFSPRNCSIS